MHCLSSSSANEHALVASAGTAGLGPKVISLLLLPGRLVCLFLFTVG